MPIQNYLYFIIGLILMTFINLGLALAKTNIFSSFEIYVTYALIFLFVILILFVLIEKVEGYCFIGIGLLSLSIWKIQFMYIASYFTLMFFFIHISLILLFWISSVDGKKKSGKKRKKNEEG